MRTIDLGLVQNMRRDDDLALINSERSDLLLWLLQCLLIHEVYSGPCISLSAAHLCKVFIVSAWNQRVHVASLPGRLV